jgi:hypothetical protein
MARQDDLRVISAGILDLRGGAGVEAELITRTIRIFGTVQASDVRAAITGAGYEVAGLSARR